MQNPVCLSRTAIDQADEHIRCKLRSKGAICESLIVDFVRFKTRGSL